MGESGAGRRGASGTSAFTIHIHIYIRAGSGIFGAFSPWLVRGGGHFFWTFRWACGDCIGVAGGDFMFEKGGGGGGTYDLAGLVGGRNGWM